jgi:hypothetical protein
MSTQANQNGYAVAFSVMAGVCIVLPVAIVWATIEKMLKLPESDATDE